MAIAEAGSLRRAAEGLGLSQPALTRQLQVLESELGATLLRRGRPPLLLTEAGRYVLDQGAKLLADAATLRMEASRLAGGRDPAIRVGVLQSLLESSFAAALLDWRRAWPSVPLRVAGFRSQQIIADVTEGRQDLGFVGAEPRGGQLASSILAEDVFVAVLPRAHALAARDDVTLAELARSAMVLPNRGLPLRTLVDDAFALAGTRPRIAAELEGIGAILALVEADLGPSLLPASAVPRRAQVVMKSLGAAAPRRQIIAVWQSRRALDIAMQELTESMRTALGRG